MLPSGDGGIDSVYLGEWTIQLITIIQYRLNMHRNSNMESFQNHILSRTSIVHVIDRCKDMIMAAQCDLKSSKQGISLGKRWRDYFLINKHHIMTLPRKQLYIKVSFALLGNNRENHLVFLFFQHILYVYGIFM